MNNLNEVGVKTTDKINELQMMAANGQGSVMTVIRSNIKNWDENLMPVCAAVGKSYLDTVAEILVACGYEIDKGVLSTYLGRARKKVK